MRKTFCDMCGKQIRAIKIIEFSSWIDHYDRRNKKFEICSDCNEKIVEAVSKMRNKNAEQ